MAVLFGNGFNATPNPWWDPNHIGDYLRIDNNRILTYDIQVGAYSVLGLKPIVSGDKFIFSVKLIFNMDNNSQHYTLGFATHGAYLNNHIGWDVYGFGLFNTGEIYFNNNIIATGFPTWNNNGDIIDIAIDRSSERAWFRVNGNYWNNDNVANPATDTNGFDFSSFNLGSTLYPGLTIEGSDGPSEYQLVMSPYGIPNGFSIIEDGGRTQSQPNPTPTPTPTPTPMPPPPIEIYTYFASTNTDACSLSTSGISVNITGDTSDFATSTSFTGDTFSTQTTGTYYITYQGNYREISITNGSNIVSVTAGTSTCPDTPITGGYYNSGVSVSSGYNPYGPGSSYLFNGSNGYLTLTGNTDTAFGTGDFTVEWNQFENVHNSHARIFAIGDYPSATFQVSLEASSFYVMENGNWVASPAYGAILQNWVHFAIVRISNITTIYKDGVSLYSYADSNDLNNTSTDLHIGQESPVSDSGAYFNGAITSFRWTKGLGIYTGNFQKPTGPLSVTASANPFGGSNTQAITAGYVKYLLQP